MRASTTRTPTATSGQGDHLAVGDPEEGAEQQAGEAVEEAAVQADEQDAAGQGEGLHGADDGRLLAPGPPDGGAGHHGDDQRGHDAPGEVAGRGADAEPDGPGRAGERHHGQGVSGEALAPEHHEPTDGPGDDGHDGPGPVGVDHEVDGKQLVEVGTEVPAAVRRRRRGHQCRSACGRRRSAWRSAWWAGASGCPTTTSLSVRGPQDLDGRPVQGGQGLRGDDLVGRPAHGAAAGHVDDTVEVRHDGVHVVGHDQHGDAGSLADLGDQRGHRGLVGEVQAVEGLVEQQHVGSPDQGLGDQEPLLLAARHLPDGPVGVGRGPDQLDDLGHPPAPLPTAGEERRAPGDGKAPPVAVTAQPHHVDAADPEVGIEAPALGQVADLADRTGPVGARGRWPGPSTAATCPAPP